MTGERKADLEARVAELEHELWLALKQGAIADGYQWTAAIHVDGLPGPWIALLTVKPIYTGEERAALAAHSAKGRSVMMDEDEREAARKAGRAWIDE